MFYDFYLCFWYFLYHCFNNRLIRSHFSFSFIQFIKFPNSIAFTKVRLVPCHIPLKSGLSANCITLPLPNPFALINADLVSCSRFSEDINPLRRGSSL